MSAKRLFIPLFVVCGMALSVSWAAAGDPKVTLSGVHMCCDNCVKGVATAIAPVKGVVATANKEGSSIEVSATDKETLQKGVDALITAGYFGKPSDATVKVDATTGAKDGKVQTLEVTGVHLCCNSCVTAMKGVVAKVDGIKADTIKSNAKSFTLTGDFEPKTFFAEMQKAGLTGKVATPSTPSAPK